MKKAFRIARNVLAMLGLFFVYLLGHGLMQYEERATASDMSCVYMRCM